MARFHYYADTPDGPVELTASKIGGLQTMRPSEIPARFAGMKTIRADSFSVWAGCGPDRQLWPVSRMIEFKINPSLHKCDPRCTGATGKRCECSCRGKNHGFANSLICAAA